MFISRPISCYTASRVSEVVEDISLDEKLVRCDYQDDVCFGKVASHKFQKRKQRKFLQIPGCSHRLQHFIYESGNPGGLQRLRQEDGARGGVQEQGDVQRGKAVLRDQRGEEQQGGEQQLCRQRQRIDSRAQRHHLRHHHDINSGSDYEMKVIESPFQEELCICEGSQCNPSSPSVSLSIVLLFSTVVVTLWNG